MMDDQIDWEMEKTTPLAEGEMEALPKATPPGQKFLDDMVDEGFPPSRYLPSEHRRAARGTPENPHTEPPAVLHFRQTADGKEINVVDGASVWASDPRVAKMATQVERRGSFDAVVETVELQEKVLRTALALHRTYEPALLSWSDGPVVNQDALKAHLEAIGKYQDWLKTRG